MQLDGMHHITMITGDAQRNIDFYAGVLGLRLVKKTVNFDAPEAYHLYFGDTSKGSPGSILTWFEFAGARPGRAGAGMIHTIQLGVESGASLDFWEARLAAHGYPNTRSEGSLRFADYDGLGLELVIVNQRNAALRANHPETPAKHAIGGVEGARAYIGRGVEIDRDCFNAIYFRQPQGILFEIATTSPGFAVDEAPEHLGEELRLPTQHEHLRPHLERILTPLVNPRTAPAPSQTTA